MTSLPEKSSKRQKTQVPLLCDSVSDSNSLSFAPTILSNIRLFELPDAAKLELKEGDSLTLIGEGGEDAVLCSSKTTYAIKKVEMSNEIYLVSAFPSEKSDFTIEAAASHYYELLPIRGKVGKLRDLLEHSKYPQYSNRMEATFYTRAECKNLIQASEKELAEFCRKIDVIELDGKMRLLNLDALKATTRNAMDSIIAGSLVLSNVSFEQLLALMASDGTENGTAVDKVLLQHVLESLCNDGSPSPNGDIWSLNAESVQMASADLLLFEHFGPEGAKKPWPMNDFFLSWEARTPTDTVTPFKPSLDLLKGIAITSVPQTQTKDRSTDVVNYGLIYAPVNTLSLDVAERIKQLFDLRSKYAKYVTGGMTSATAKQPTFFLLNELTPYFQEFVEQPKSIVALLLPYTTLLNDQYYLK